MPSRGLDVVRDERARSAGLSTPPSVVPAANFPHPSIEKIGILDSKSPNNRGSSIILDAPKLTITAVSGWPVVLPISGLPWQTVVSTGIVGSEIPKGLLIETTYRAQPVTGTAKAICLFGRVTWGIGGASYEAVFDWGKSVYVSASFARVDCIYATNTGFGTSPVVEASASFGYGDSKGPATFTYEWALTGSGGALPGITLPVPPFARGVTVGNTGATTTTAPALVVTVSGALLSSAYYNYTDRTNVGIQRLQIPLPTNCPSITVTNTLAAPTSGFAIFDLYL